MTSEAVEMTDCAKPGKAKSAFPPFAQSLEIAKAIPTFPQHGDGDLPPKEQKTQIKERSPQSFLQAHCSIGKCLGSLRPAVSVGL